MKFIRFTLKVIITLAVVTITLFQRISLLFIGSTAVIFSLLLGICFLLSVTGYLTMNATSTECMEMFITSFIRCCLPHIDEWLIVRIIALKLILIDFIRS